jgi:hypothetical protein
MKRTQVSKATLLCQGLVNVAMRALGSSSPTFSLTFLLSVPYNVGDNSHICYTKIYGMIINLFLMLHVPNLILRESYLAFQPLQKFKTETEGLYLPSTT